MCIFELINAAYYRASDAHLNSICCEMLTTGGEEEEEEEERQSCAQYRSVRAVLSFKTRFNWRVPPSLLRDEVYRVTFFIKLFHSRRIFIIHCRRRVITVSLKFVSRDQSYVPLCNIDVRLSGGNSCVIDCCELEGFEMKFNRGQSLKQLCARLFNEAQFSRTLFAKKHNRVKLKYNRLYYRPGCVLTREIYN